MCHIVNSGFSPPPFKQLLPESTDCRPFENVQSTEHILNAGDFSWRHLGRSSGADCWTQYAGPCKEVPSLMEGSCRMSPCSQWWPAWSLWDSDTRLPSLPAEATSEWAETVHDRRVIVQLLVVFSIDSWWEWYFHLDVASRLILPQCGSPPPFGFPVIFAKLLFCPGNHSETCRFCQTHVGDFGTVPKVLAH